MTGPAPPRALLLGDDLGVFLAVARSLGRRGVEVHLVPAEDDSPALASRYIAELHTLPAYLSDPVGWLRSLKALIAAHGFRLIIPCSDQGLALLERHSDELGRDRLALPNRQALAAFADKTQTRSLAARLRVPVAPGGPVGATDLAGLGLPLVLKPAQSYRPGERLSKTPARIVRTPEEMERILPALAKGWLAEGFFAGEGVGLSVVAREGRILLALQHRRLSTLSETGGSSVRITESLDPHLLADVEKLAAAVALTGPAMFEFRRRADEHILLEVNARFWGSLPLALAAGADFPALAWDVFTGAAPAIQAGYRAGLTRTNLSGELDRRVDRLETAAGFAAKLAAAVSLLALLAMLVTPRHFDSWAADDPAPFREERRQVLKRLLSGLRRHSPRLSPSPAS